MRTAIGFVVTAIIVVGAMAALSRLDISGDDDTDDSTPAIKRGPDGHPPPPQFPEQLFILFLQARDGAGPAAVSTPDPTTAVSEPQPWQQIALGRYLADAGQLLPEQAAGP